MTQKIKKILLFTLVIISIFYMENPIAREIEASSDLPAEDPYKILLVMDDNYGGNCEFIIQIFQDYGWEITTAASKKSITGCSYVGFKEFIIDQTLSSIDIQDYDCISILPGNEYPNLNNSEFLIETIRDAVSSGIIVTAWCRGVRLLAKADVIQGRTITGKDDYIDEYIAAGATFKSLNPPIRDGNIITSVRSKFYRQETCDLIKDTVENYIPAIIDFSSFLGGTGDEKGISSRLNFLGDVVVDSQGNIIVLGRSASGNFPVKDAYQENKSKSIDITITKFTSRGDILFSTFFGGSGDEWGTSVALDTQDNIVFGGTTTSSDFPLHNAYQSDLLGGTEANNDAFIAKLSSDGQTLLYSTLFGGTGSDWCYALAVSSTGEIAVTGTSDSTDLPLVNAVQDEKGGGRDIFISKFDSTGQELLLSTYLGGFGHDSGRGLAFDSNDNLFASGELSGKDFGTETVFQKETGGSSDAFVVSFNSIENLRFLTYLGGSTIERSTDLVIDSEDNILVTGYVYSNNFPTENAFQIEIQGRCDVFITKITNDGTEKIFSTYLGGEALDQGHAISVDGEDNVIVVGDTMSAEYPCTVDPISNHTGQNEAFITKLSKDGRELIFSTTLGGENEDTAIATINTSNNAQIIVGFTYSPHFPTVAASQAMYGGDCDMFLSKIYLPTRESNENTKTIPGFSPLLIIMIGTISVGIKIRKKHQK